MAINQADLVSVKPIRVGWKMNDSIRKVVQASTTYAFRERAREAFQEARLSLIHLRSCRKARRLPTTTHLKLQLGCGPRIKPGWINIDLFDEGSDLRLDVREPWPFGDGSVSIIYSEHVFEHFEYPLEVGKVLSEAWRVLEPGGKFTLGIPDFEFATQSYVTRDPEFHRREREHGLPDGITTPMDILNYTFRQGREHKYAYDFETLTKVLNEARFVSIVERRFDPALDSADREWGTLYAEAAKPLDAAQG